MRICCTLLPWTILLAGCAKDRFAITQDAEGMTDRHSIIAKVTCTSASFRHDNTLRDQFHLKAMPPRVRWTAVFHIEQVFQGNVPTTNFLLDDARGFAREHNAALWLQTNVSYTVGFDRIKKGKVYGLEIYSPKKE